MMSSCRWMAAAATALVWVTQPSTTRAAAATRVAAARPQSPVAAPSASPAPADLARRSIPLRSGIGTAHDPVTTRNTRAQQYCDQGLAYLHSYNWMDAARSFHEALRADASLALAQLGLSYALGELGDGDGARTASRRARELAGPASPAERFRIELRARQLAAVDAPGDAAAARAYRGQLSRISTEFPTNVELLLIAGHAQDPADSHGMSGGQASLAFYERARVLAPDYFAVDHYIAHAYENLGRPRDALPFAHRFAKGAPAIPHAHHMYGHVLRQVDRMREAIAEFELADRLHRERAVSERLPLAVDWHYRHNLDLLATAYQYSGQMKKAAALLEQSFDLPASGLLGQALDVNKRAWPLFLLARQRPADALAAARQMQTATAPLTQALGHLLASRALQASGQFEAAAEAGNGALRTMKAIGPLGGRLRPDFEIAQGEFQLRRGDASGGALLKAGISKLAADRSPDAWTITVFQLEAATRTARETKRLDLAAEFVALLQQQAPQYAGTHYELARLAELRGDGATARREYAAAAAGWLDADADFPEAVESRRRASAAR